MKISVVIPTYNESDNLQALVQMLVALDRDLQIHVVDDNSPDGTGKLADELAERYPSVHPIHRPRKMGLGTAHIAGFRAAFALGSDRILTMDADFSHHPRYIPSLIELSNSHSVVIGSRYVPGGGTLDCSLPRRILSRGANLVARLALGLRAQDCTAGFRCYRREVLEAIDLDSIFSDGYSFLVEMLYCCQRLDCRIGEVPIIFEDRHHGASKISRREILKAMVTVFRLALDRFGYVSLPFAPPRRKRAGKWNT